MNDARDEIQRVLPVITKQRQQTLFVLALARVCELGTTVLLCYALCPNANAVELYGIVATML